MKDETNKTTVMDEIAEWWEYLDLSEKVAVLWLAAFAVALVTLGIMFPIFGIILFGVVSIIGAIVSLLHLFG
jgi:uncharacterized membrane protein